MAHKPTTLGTLLTLTEELSVKLEQMNDLAFEMLDYAGDGRHDLVKRSYEDYHMKMVEVRALLCDLDHQHISAARQSAWAFRSKL